MADIYGMKNIQVKTIEVNKNDLTAVNKFLKDHDGNIIDIQIIPLLYGCSRFMIIYKVN